MQVFEIWSFQIIFLYQKDLTEIWKFHIEGYPRPFQAIDMIKLTYDSHLLVVCVLCWVQFWDRLHYSDADRAAAWD